MSIRKEIKAIIWEANTCVIDNREAVHAIEKIVNRPKPIKSPKPLPSRAALAEEAIAAAGEYFNKPLTPQEVQKRFEEMFSNKQEPDEHTKSKDPLNHDVLTLTISHYCETNEFTADIKHAGVAPVVVALAIESLKRFSREELGAEVATSNLEDITELLKKF